MPEPLRISIQPSRRLTLYLWLLHLLALLGVLLLPLPIIDKQLAVIFMLASASYYHYKYALYARRGQFKEVVLKEAHCQIIVNNQRKFSAELKQRHFVSNLFVILSLSVRGRWLTQHLVLCRDAVDEDVFRQIKVRLRFPL